MPLIYVVIVLLVVGVLLYLVNTLPYVDAKIKTIINAVVLIVVVLWVLQLFGILDYLTTIRVPRR
jgi:hypothetical protein